MLSKVFLVTASASGMLAVVLGAFGAHALKAKLDSQMLSAWQTAVQYHFFHTLALLAVVVLMRQGSALALGVSGWLFCVGITLFSGSLYALALGGPTWLGPVTPVGGLCLIAGWASLLMYAIGSTRGNLL